MRVLVLVVFVMVSLLSTRHSLELKKLKKIGSVAL